MVIFILAILFAVAVWTLLSIREHVRYLGLIFKVIAGLTISEVLVEFWINDPTFFTREVFALAIGGALAVFYIFNLQLWSFLVLILGIASNAVVIFANGGKMPLLSNFNNVSLNGRYCSIDNNTVWPWLGDYLSFGGYLWSVGDILIGLGLSLIMIQAIYAKEMKWPDGQK